MIISDDDGGRNYSRGVAFDSRRLILIEFGACVAERCGGLCGIPECVAVASSARHKVFDVKTSYMFAFMLAD